MFCQLQDSIFFFLVVVLLFCNSLKNLESKCSSSCNFFNFHFKSLVIVKLLQNPERQIVKNKKKKEKVKTLL